MLVIESPLPSRMVSETLWDRLCYNVVLLHSCSSKGFQSMLEARWGDWTMKVVKTIFWVSSCVSCTVNGPYTGQSCTWDMVVRMVKLDREGGEVRSVPLTSTSGVQTLWTPSISGHSDGFVRLPLNRPLSCSCEPALPLCNGSVWKGFVGNSNWRPTDRCRSYYLTACH